MAMYNRYYVFVNMIFVHQHRFRPNYAHLILKYGIYRSETDFGDLVIAVRMVMLRIPAGPGSA